MVRISGAEFARRMRPYSQELIMLCISPLHVPSKIVKVGNSRLGFPLVIADSERDMGQLTRLDTGALTKELKEVIILPRNSESPQLTALL